MYKKIMVPLDGSELAECVLPHLEAFMKGFSPGQVLLIRVVEPLRMSNAVPAAKIETIQKYESERASLARTYLDQVSERVSRQGVDLHRKVIVGGIAECLIGYARDNHVDLILMATHGRSGITRWVRGSVADRMLRSAHIPVLMVRAPGTKGGI